MIETSHYFVHSQGGNVAKNKLQLEFGEYLMNMNGTLIKASDIRKLKSKIANKVSELNEKHSRCKPINITWWNCDKGVQRITGFYTTYCYIRSCHIEEL